MPPCRRYIASRRVRKGPLLHLGPRSGSGIFRTSISRFPPKVSFFLTRKVILPHTCNYMVGGLQAAHDDHGYTQNPVRSSTRSSRNRDDGLWEHSRLVSAFPDLMLVARVPLHLPSLFHGGSTVQSCFSPSTILRAPIAAECPTRSSSTPNGPGGKKQ